MEYYLHPVDSSKADDGKYIIRALYTREGVRILADELAVTAGDAINLTSYPAPLIGRSEAHFRVADAQLTVGGLLVTPQELGNTEVIYIVGGSVW